MNTYIAKLEQNIYETGEQQVSLETYFKHATQSKTQQRPKICYPNSKMKYEFLKKKKKKKKNMKG